MASSAQLKAWFEERCLEISASQAQRDFMIQYTVFEREDDRWYMNCCVAGTFNEGIYDVSEVNYTADDATCVGFRSWKDNYPGAVMLTKAIDNRGKTDDERVCFLINLYPEYQPKHFKGLAWTRGGFTGWNWLELKEETQAAGPIDVIAELIRIAQQ